MQVRSQNTACVLSYEAFQGARYKVTFQTRSLLQTKTGRDREDPLRKGSKQADTVGIVVCTCNPSTGEGERGNPQDLLANLAKSVSSLPQKNKSGDDKMAQ